MYVPSKSKYVKAFGSDVKGKACFAGNSIAFGEYGIKALDLGKIDGKQIESARRVLSAKMGKVGKIWVRIFPSIPLSVKPLEVRMGGGKASVEKWQSYIRPGMILFEIAGVSYDLAKTALTCAANKLPVKCRITSLRSNIYLSD